MRVKRSSHLIRSFLGENTMTVLVVDDEPSFRLAAREVLMAEGYDVLTAENGEEALRKLSLIEPDIIVSDIYMPVMDGRKLHRAVREMPRYEKLPFLFVSGYSDQQTMTAMCDPRYDGFASKSSPAEDLISWIKYLTTPVEKRGGTFPGQPLHLS